MANSVTLVQKIEADSDHLLVDRARSGDRHAFDLLVLKYQSRLLTVVMRLVANQNDALDVLQDTFIKVYRSLQSFRGESAFYSWLYRIAVNTAKNHLASKAREPFGSLTTDDLKETDRLTGFQDQATPDDLVQADELQLAILDAIECLPEDLRYALTLREIEGMSYEDIAQAMNCPIGTVRSRIFRARDQVVLSLSEKFQGTLL